MARTKARLSAGVRLADYLAVGLLAMTCPLDRVRDALAAHGAQSKRNRGLPHEVIVYFVITMVLYANVAYEEVLRLVAEGLRQIIGAEAFGTATVTKGAISQARVRVGCAPLRQLYREQVAPNGTPGMPGVWYRGLRLMAIDSSTLVMPDEATNAQHFGYPGGSRGICAFPQMRFVALVECGTHTLCHANPGPCTVSELTLAEPVIDQADATMLITAERIFFNYSFWRRAEVTGARLLFRARTSQRLVREADLPDGSYLTTLHATSKDRRRNLNGTVVRVIEYALEGVPATELSYRLVTNCLDAEVAPAAELAALYHRRQTIEQTFDEFKVLLVDRAVALRSKRPELVEQEFYALLLTHAAIRRFMTHGTQVKRPAAEDVSFTEVVRILKRRLPTAAAVPP